MLFWLRGGIFDVPNILQARCRVDGTLHGSLLFYAMVVRDYVGYMKRFSAI
jgi:hypothetical protein